MESLAVFVGILLLAMISGSFVAFALSFVDNNVARFFVYLFALLSGGMSVWMAFATNALGSWVLATIMVCVGGASIWNSNRIRTNNEEIKRLTNE